MARIRQVALSSDLFGDKARGVSLPDITWETYAEIVRTSAKKFGRSLRRMTPGLIKQLIDRRNWNSGSTLSFVARKTLFVTVIVTEVCGRSVTVNLFLDDLEAEGAVMDALLRDITAEVRCNDLGVKDGSLVGRITLPTAVVPLFPERMARARSEVPRAPAQGGVHAEELFLKQAGRSFAR